MKFCNVIVGLANPGRQTVPKPRSSGCKAPVTELCVGPWNTTHVDVGRNRRRERRADSHRPDTLHLNREAPCSLVDKESQLEVDSLSDQKLVELPQHGVWSHRRVPVTSHAAAFCTDWRCMSTEQ